MLRLMTQAEVKEYLPESAAYSAATYGADMVFSTADLERMMAANAAFFIRYIDDTKTPPAIIGVTNAWLISESEFKKMQTGEKTELTTDPWQPSDGPAVLWIGGCASRAINGASHMLAELLNLIEKHPHRKSIKNIAAFLFSGDGAILGQAMGFEDRGTRYGVGNFPIVERPFSDSDLSSLGTDLLNVIRGYGRSRAMAEQRRTTPAPSNNPS